MHKSNENAASAIDLNIDAVASLVDREESSVPGHQKAIERIFKVLSVPAFGYGLGLAIALWIGVNLGVQIKGGVPWDSPPFPWLEIAVSILALLMTSLVVITQARQGRISERNAHLDLQVNLLVDQKVTKIIELIEEMRTDSPHLLDRVDHKAEQLQVPADPTHLASKLAERMPTARDPAEA